MGRIRTLCKIYTIILIMCYGHYKEVCIHIKILKLYFDYQKNSYIAGDKSNLRKIKFTLNDNNNSIIIYIELV